MKTINIIKSCILTIAIFSSQFANSQQFKWNPETKKFEKTNKTEINSMQAKIKTTKGDILIELEYFIGVEFKPKVISLINSIFHCKRYNCQVPKAQNRVIKKTTNN